MSTKATFSISMQSLEYKCVFFIELNTDIAHVSSMDVEHIQNFGGEVSIWKSEKNIGH
jgi:hypothetical protein